mmetsp:Transcript_3302/g.9113  ORF Transcript_3302/g.9113 Transcript_3302/m.9113 type:complete len:237 (-) Transcript_3302:84-794(-)
MMERFSRVPIVALLNYQEPQPRMKLERLPPLPGVAEMLAPDEHISSGSSGTTMTEHDSEESARRRAAVPPRPKLQGVAALMSPLELSTRRPGVGEQPEPDGPLPLRIRGSAQNEERAEKAPKVPGPSRRRWTPQEDQLVGELVRKHGPSRWDTIAAELPGRSAQHVRLRYTNYLRDHTREGQAFTNAEDARILREGTSGPRKWARLAHELGRSHCSVKNRFQMLQRKADKQDHPSS